MTIDGEYEASPWEWVRDQVETYEKSGGTEGAELRETGWKVLIVTTRGAKSGKVRKTPLMRVEHDGEWLLVASLGGAPNNPQWYSNLVAHPDEVLVQDGPAAVPVALRELATDGDERAAWWERAVAAFPPYAEYKQKTERIIPLFVATPT